MELPYMATPTNNSPSNPLDSIYVPSSVNVDQISLLDERKQNMEASLNQMTPNQSVFQKLYDTGSDIDSKLNTTVVQDWSEQSQKEPNKELADYLKQTHSELKQNYNENLLFFNGQKDVLMKVRKVNDLQNRIDRAIDEKRDEIQRQISVKERLIEMNNSAAKKKEQQVAIIVGSSTLLMIGILAVVAYLSGTISGTTLGGILVLLCFLAILSVFFFRINLSKDLRKLEKEIAKLPQEFTREADKLNQAALNWVGENCECDEDSNQA